MDPHHNLSRAPFELHTAGAAGRVEERIFDAAGRPAAFSSSSSATAITALSPRKKNKRKKDVQLWVTVVEGSLFFGLPCEEINIETQTFCKKPIFYEVF